MIKFDVIRAKLESLLSIKRTLKFPVPITIAKARLSSAFTSRITISRGFFLASEEYSGYLEGDILKIDFSIKGRGRSRYRLWGKLIDDGTGVKLEIKINEPAYQTLLPLIALIIIYFAQPSDRHFPFVIMAFFSVFIVLGIRWHRSSAASSVSNLIQKIIVDQYK